MVTPLACSLGGRDERIVLLPGTRGAALYGTESYRCNYGVSPAWKACLEDRALRITARGPDGEVRLLELEQHPLFVATRCGRARPRRTPVLRAFVEASNGS